jgi:hypothetical protein
MNLTQNKTAVAIMNQAFGEDWLVNITDAFGYQTEIVNPEYVPAQGNEFLYNEQTMEPVLDEDGKETPNPDYVAAIGEQFMDNPQDRTSFLDAVILDNGLQGVLDRMLEVDVQKYRKERRAAFDQARVAIKGSVSTGE